MKCYNCHTEEAAHQDYFCCHECELRYREKHIDKDKYKDKYGEE